MFPRSTGRVKLLIDKPLKREKRASKELGVNGKKTKGTKHPTEKKTPLGKNFHGMTETMQPGKATNKKTKEQLAAPGK